VSTVKITGVATEDLDTVFPDAAPLLEKALSNTLSLQDTKQALLRGEMQLWIAYEDKIITAFITEIVDYPQRKVVRIILCGGDKLDSWVKDFLNLVEAWGKGCGAKSMEIVGRRGWVRALKKYGYNETNTVIEKEL
jgi:hypothetical protein